ncbi:MAG: NAD(P)-binding domain-containing protein [Sneathiella sp.]|nr:NAD(P)-binding domain-containing protein [Sneathiella sp.]
MAKLDNTTVGFIGADNMGKTMAKRIQSAGATTYAYDRSPAVRYEIARASISLCQSPAEIATKAHGGVIILMLSDHDAAASAIEGDNSLLSTLEADTLVINMGNLDAPHSKRYAALAAEKGAIWVNAPVIGDADAALNGELEITATACDDDYNRALPILQCLSQSVHHVG